MGTIVKEEIITGIEVEEFWQKRYRMTTITPLVEKPKMTVRELSQDQLSEFLEGYHEYAEFIVELKEI